MNGVNPGGLRWLGAPDYSLLCLPSVFSVPLWLIILFLDDAAEDLALPVGAVNGPALDRPAALLHDFRPAVVGDVALALLLGRRQLLPRPHGVAAAAADVVVV